MYKSAQQCIYELAYSNATMNDESLPFSREETGPNDFKAQQDLAQIVSKVVREMENDTTLLMIQKFLGLGGR
jgi:hypothetical protein